MADKAKVHGHQQHSLHGHTTWCGRPVVGNAWRRNRERQVPTERITDAIGEVTCEHCCETYHGTDARATERAEAAGEQERPAEPWKPPEPVRPPRTRPPYTVEPVIEVRVGGHTMLLVTGGDKRMIGAVAAYAVEVYDSQAAWGVKLTVSNIVVAPLEDAAQVEQAINATIAEVYA